MAEGNHVGLARLSDTHRAVETVLEGCSPGSLPTGALEWQPGEHLGALFQQEFTVHLGVEESLEASEPAPPFFCPDYGNHMSETEFDDLYAYLKSIAPKKARFRFK